MVKQLTSGLQESIAGGINGGLLSRPQFRGSTLDLDFAGTKSLKNTVGNTDLVTFTRASSGTYVDGNRVIRTTPVNLFLKSQTFGSPTWNKTGVSVTTASIDSPFDTSTVYQMTATATPSFLNQDSSDLIANRTYTQSIFAKAGSRNFIQLAPSTGFAGSPSHVNFELTGEGTVGTNTTGGVASIEKIGNDGWYRVTLTAQRDSTNPGNPRILFSVTNSLTGGRLLATSGSVHIWGAQIEEGTAATPYIKTDTTISGAPRFDHDPTTGESLGLLIEEARTNFLKYSDQFDNAAWTKIGPHNYQINSTIAPDGTQTADTFGFDNAVIFQDNGTVSNGTTYTGSIYLKSNSNQTLKLRVASGAASDSQEISVTTEWQRFVVTHTAANNTDPLRLLIEGRDANLTVNLPADFELSLWGAQLEVGSFPTSYIPTDGTPGGITRAADVAEITGANFSSFYNQSEGTVFAQSRINRVCDTAGTGVVFADDGTNNNYVGLFYTGSGATGSVVRTGGVDSLNTNPYGSVSANTTIQQAVAYKAGDSIGAGGGNLTAVNLSTNIPAVNRLLIGDFVGSGAPLDGHIKRLTYFNTRLPNATLQNITN